MISTLFNQTTNIPDNGNYDERKQVVDNELQTSKDKTHVNIEKSLLKNEETARNNTDSETDPNVSQRMLMRKLTSKIIVVEN